MGGKLGSNVPHCDPENKLAIVRPPSFKNTSIVDEITYSPYWWCQSWD